MALEEDAAGPSRNMECLYPTNGIIIQGLVFTKTVFLVVKQWLIDMWVKAGWWMDQHVPPDGRCLMLVNV